MDLLLQFVLDLFNNHEAGELDNFSEPADPGDLGSALTQDEIDFVKKLKKEMEEKFNPP